MASAIGDVLPLSTMQFASGGDSFRITGTPIPRSVAALDAGIDLAPTSRATLGIGYGGQFGSGASDQTLHARFRLGAMKRRSRLQSRAPARECGALSICEAAVPFGIADKTQPNARPQKQRAPVHVSTL